jgi:hypothetical protein
MKVHRRSGTFMTDCGLGYRVTDEQEATPTMTPGEQRVIEAALAWYEFGAHHDLLEVACAALVKERKAAVSMLQYVEPEWEPTKEREHPCDMCGHEPNQHRLGGEGPCSIAGCFCREFLGPAPEAKR